MSELPVYMSDDFYSDTQQHDFILGFTSLHVFFNKINPPYKWDTFIIIVCSARNKPPKERILFGQVIT